MPSLAVPVSDDELKSLLLPSRHSRRKFFGSLLGGAGLLVISPKPSWAANLEIDNYATSASFTISGNSLASSTAGVGRQSTLIDNTANLYIGAIISLNIKLGTTPTSSTACYVYLLRSDNNTPIIDDGAGASDAGLTVINAPLIGVLSDGASASTGQLLKLNLYVYDLAPKWGIAVVNSTGVALDASAGITASFIGIKKNLNG